MVTTTLSISAADRQQMLSNNNRQSLIDRPIICVDGYLISCIYDGESCTPMNGIKIEDLLASFKEELNKGKRKSCPDLKSNDSGLKTSTRGRSKTVTSNVQKSVFSNQFMHEEEFLGVQQTIESPLRNSFILSVADRDTVEKRHIEDCKLNYSTETISPCRQLELDNEVQWFEEFGSDYINTENVSSCSELHALISTLMKSTTAALVTLKINSQTEITVTYQFMKNFKQEYMIVRINKSYCMLMKAF